MPDNRKALLRYKVLDKCFSDRYYKYFIEDLMEEVNEQLEDAGVKPVSKKQIYDDIKFILISPEELKVPDYIREAIEEAGCEYEEVTNLDDVMGDLDILYMTRVQRERFFNEEDYIRLKDSFILTKDKMKEAREDMLVLHPLPRVNEISVKVDKDPRAVYFKQAQYGVYVRMALILTLMEVEV